MDKQNGWPPRVGKCLMLLSEVQDDEKTPLNEISLLIPDELGRPCSKCRI